LKAPFFEIVRKGEQLFHLVARLVPTLEIDAEACAAACTNEIYAAREACRLAAEGIPFRDAYATVAQQLEDGSFNGTNATDGTNKPEFENIAVELATSEGWLRERRDFLALTTKRLFDWK
jgi:argininosuccinate lyase